MGKKQDTKQNSRTCAPRGRRPPGPADVPAMLSVKKIPSMRGGNSLPLHAASYQRAAPSPSALPAPPMRWTAGPAGGPLPTLARSAQPSEDAPAQQLQRSDFVVRQLQGNLLHTLIAPALPELAGKVTGMLLEGLTVEEVGAVLSDARASARSASPKRSPYCALPATRARARRSASTSLPPSAPRSRNRRGCGCRRERRRAGTRPRKYSAWHDAGMPCGRRSRARPVLRSHGRRSHALYVDSE